MVQLANSGVENIENSPEESQLNWARVPQISVFHKLRLNIFMITVMFTNGLISMNDIGGGEREGKSTCGP